ncbi:hypothetical protein [uncultured Veillonella sp.]|uniref:hypothetical protein n=1 Tax=uncultured Veillonella sp. TaxID=159268 RepID=UPI00260DB562|nr:hypothetical protein [uncultured Veillonella sp.]
MKKSLLPILALAFVSAMSSSVHAERVALQNQNYQPGRTQFLPYVYVNTVDANYFQYSNARFGMSSYVPSNFYLAYGPSNGDGARFADGLGGALTISGSHNSNHATVEASYAGAVNYYQPSYKALGDSWYVISYERGGYIYYVKSFVNSQFIKTLQYKYPVSNRYHYEAYLPTIEGSFRP